MSGVRSALLGVDAQDNEIKHKSLIPLERRLASLVTTVGSRDSKGESNPRRSRAPIYLR